MKRLKPILRFQFREYILSAPIFLAVIAAVILFILLIASHWIDLESCTYQAFCVSGAAYMLVLSPTALRASLRLSAQMGASRRSTFLGFALFSLCSAVLTAAAGECLLTLCNHISLATRGLSITDIYPLLYLDGKQILDLTPGEHLHVLLFNAAVMLTGVGAGTAFSMLHWRMGRLGEILLIVLCGTAAVWLPFLLIGIAANSTADFLAWMDYPVLTFTLLAVLLYLLSCFLGRNVNIRAAK